MNLITSDMAVTKVTLNASRFWPKGLPYTQAAKELGMHYHSVSNFCKGTQQKGEWITLFRLAEYLSQKTGQTIHPWDLLVIEHDDEE